MTIFSIMKDLYDGEKNDSEISLASLEKYSKYFPQEIVKYFFFKHRACYTSFKEFDDIEIGDKKIELSSLSTKEIFDLKYCNFCNLRDEDENVFHELNWYFEYHFCNGSWDFPLVLIKRNKEIFVVDGMNRYRLFRCYIKYTEKAIKEEHKVYFLN